MAICAALAAVPLARAAGPADVSRTLAPSFALADLPSMSAAGPADAAATSVRTALATTNRYYLNTWWTRYMAGLEPLASYADRAAKKGTIDSEQLRRYSSVALALAAPIATRTYDARVTGVPEATARERVVGLVQVLVRTHRANVGLDAGWGRSWQSALWASETALAGWLAGTSLPEADRLLLARMIESEADAVNAREIHYLRDRHGNVLTPGDSGAEELAWDALGELTAVELLPRHPRRHAWAVDAYQRFLSAYALPRDVTSARLVHGRALSSWLAGSNVEPSGLVVNHGRANPDYTVSMSLHAGVLSGLTGNGVPEAVLVNQDVLHRALTSTTFRGGTVYVPGSAAIHYPYSPDWGTHRQVVYGVFDLEVGAFGLDRGQGVAARTWAARHLGHTRTMQQRFVTGQTYGAISEDRYFAREEWTGALLAYAELTEWLRAKNKLRVDRRPASAKLPVA